MLSRGGKAEYVAPIDVNHGVDAGGVRLHHAPKSGFGQFNHPIIMDDEIQAGVEGKVVGHGSQVEVHAGRDDRDFTKDSLGLPP